MTYYIDENNRVTAGNIRDCDTSDVIPRLTEVFEMALPYMQPKYFYPFHMMVVDLGARDGYLLDILQENDFKCVGVDTCIEAIGKAYHRNDKLVIRQDNLEDMSESVEDEEFDFAFCIHTLEHCKYPDKAVDEMHRILKPNGMVLIEIPVEEPEYVDDPKKHGHYNSFTSPEQLEELFEDWELIEHTWQQTKSHKPWHRWIYKRREHEEDRTREN